MKQEEYKWNEKLWKPIIRPPRYSYKLSGLGSEAFMVQGIIVKRTDFSIKNNRNLILQCSLFEPIKVKDKPHPCIIYLHGNSGCRIESHSIIDYVIPSYISVCGIDLSGSGQSQGEYISLGYWESQDQKKYILIQHQQDCGVDQWVQLLLFCQPVKTQTFEQQFVTVLFQIFRFYARIWLSLDIIFLIFALIVVEAHFNVDDLNLLQILALSNDLSIIFLQAKQDELIQTKHASLLIENFRGKKKLITFDGTHNSLRPKEAMDETVELIKKEFGAESWNQTTFQKEIKLSSRHSSVNAPLLRASKTSIIPQTEDTEQ
ncbi:unnamed protein product (macronuclear) [Paramecium tetraurelia]|uniref:Serine aminopeptidase S33 domain-containing protein n=1 Tax=Paramecium tetraurelia TaxID=5888 RepID=A0D4M1_PARTE|nr:uncharacterized protein GSPATT00013435001 [Paramecium tetraurelia]CAK77988.1 unnamed protein product [Paramecium tetraurelia]|eukprot:XP_001445385.1 hypothetical protein (macronuclear) [Paramecium tetraurelia strain d4-2]